MKKVIIITILLFLLAGFLMISGCDQDKAIDTMMANPEIAEKITQKMMENPEFKENMMWVIVADTTMMGMMMDSLITDHAMMDKFFQRMMDDDWSKEQITTKAREMRGR
ncbi:MAG: hypothetical protein WBD28_09190 [Candidatus Zixiibacteriota bacterium]